MSRYALEHYYEVVPNSKLDVSTCLMHLADCDCDFNGENGSEYRWKEAEGFESNAEYCLSIAAKEPTPKAMIEKFVSMWMDKDYYYKDYNLGIIVQDDKLFMSLVYTIGA